MILKLVFLVTALLGLLSFFFGFSRFNYIITTLNLINIFFAFDSLLCSIIYKTSFILNIGEWFQLESLNVGWEFVLSPFTVSLGFTISLIASHIIIYSVDYTKTEINSVKFISFLSLFTFFMLIGVWSSNLLQLIIGWEGVGIMSYLLINFYDFRSEANKSAMKALLVNKVGDIGFLAGIVMSYTIFSTILLSSKFELNSVIFMKMTEDLLKMLQVQK